MHHSILLFMTWLGSFSKSFSEGLFVKDYLKVKINYRNLFSFIHYFSRLGGLEFSLQKPCWFIPLIMSLLRWFVIQSLITVSTHLSGTSRCSMGWQLPGGQEPQEVPTGFGRAGASPARAHPTTPSKGAGQAERRGSWRQPRDQIIKNVRVDEAGLRLSQEVSPWVRVRIWLSGVRGQGQRHGGNADAK